MSKYWVGVASKEHVMVGVVGGFAMLNHGKKAPLERMSGGDYLIYYSPKSKLSDVRPLQRFVTIGRMKEGESYQVKMTDDFVPYRKDVEYLKCEETEIRPLIETLDFIQKKKSWGYAFRFGHIEISKSDFQLIARAMKADI